MWDEVERRWKGGHSSPERLAEVMDLLSLLSLIIYLLYSDLKALHDSSEYLGRVM